MVCRSLYDAAILMWEMQVSNSVLWPNCINIQLLASNNGEFCSESELNSVSLLLPVVTQRISGAFFSSMEKILSKKC